MLITASRVLRLVIAVGMIPIAAGSFSHQSKIGYRGLGNRGRVTGDRVQGTGDRATVSRRQNITIAEMYLATRQRDGLPESSMGPRLQTALKSATGVSAESRSNAEEKTQTNSLRYSILDSSFIVHSQDFVYNAFSLAYGARLEGDWRVKSKDIEVLIIDASALDSYRNGGQYSFYYDQRAGSDHISVDLPAGEFAVVFNNRYSILTDKSVKATLCAEVDQ